MKFSCTRDNLFRGLSVTSHLGGRNVDLPILSNVLLKTGGGGLTLTATNLEMAVTCLVRGKMEEEGEFTVPAKLFSDFVSLLPSEQVDLQVIDGVLHITCKNFSTKINGLSASEFPLVPAVQGGETYKFNAQNFKDAASQVLFSASQNEARPELSGVSLRIHDPNVGSGKATLAATDSYRLAEKVILVQGGNNPLSVIIPARTLSEVSRIISLAKDDVDSPDTLELVISENQLMIRFGLVELMSRTIDGKYPDYRQIIPTTHKTEAVFDVPSLVKAVRTASLFSRTGLFDVVLNFSPEDKKITVRGSDTTRGENKGDCEAELNGEDNTVVVNYRYLLDGLQALGSGEATLNLIDGNNPCVLTPGKTKKEDYQYIVMPIKQ